MADDPTRTPGRADEALSPRPQRWGGWLLALVPVAAGAAMRLWGLRGQVVWGDEEHAIRTALDWDLPKILTTYRVADNCIPWTAYLRLLMDAGHPLTELSLRMPSVVAGLLCLLLIPLAVAKAVDRRSALVLTWGLALSPALIYYSRIARPYAVVALLGFVALTCFWRFWEGTGRWAGRFGWAVGYGVAGATAAWFHPGAGPFVAAPLAFAAGDLALRRLPRARRARAAPAPAGEATPGLGGLFLAGALLAALVAAFLVPAANSFFKILRMKSNGKPIGLTTLRDVAQLLAGTPCLWIAIGAWTVAGAGLAWLWRERRRLALYTATPVAVLVVALLVLHPFAARVPVISGRYLVVALPILLLWMAHGLVQLWDGRGGGRRTPARSKARLAGRIVAATLVAALWATHPYAAEPALRFGPFAGSEAAIELYLPSPRLSPEEVPEAYRLIGREPGAGAVVAIDPFIYDATGPLDVALWSVYRRPVILAARGSWPADPRLAFRTLKSVRPKVLVESGARFVTFQLDRYSLARRVAELRRGAWPPPETPAQRAERARVQGVLENGFRSAWGPPRLVSGGSHVWDLAVVRWGRESSRPADGRRSARPTAARRPGGSEAGGGAAVPSRLASSTTIASSHQPSGRRERVGSRVVGPS